MDFKLDHIFVLVEPSAKSGDILKDIGFLESFSRKHKGQGTANRRFVFDNGMLELLYIHDPYEAEHGSAKELKLLQRSQSSIASPFGLVFSKSQLNTNPQSKPFRGFHYQPDFFPEPVGFYIGNNASDIVEPLCVFADFINPGEAPKQKNNSFGKLIEIELHVPKSEFTQTLTSVCGIEGIKIIPGCEHLLVLCFDDSVKHIDYDLMPELPILIKYK